MNFFLILFALILNNLQFWYYFIMLIIITVGELNFKRWMIGKKSLCVFYSRNLHLNLMIVVRLIIIEIEITGIGIIDSRNDFNLIEIINY